MYTLLLMIFSAMILPKRKQRTRFSSSEVEISTRVLLFVQLYPALKAAYISDSIFRISIYIFKFNNRAYFVPFSICKVKDYFLMCQAFRQLFSGVFALFN